MPTAQRIRELLDAYSAGPRILEEAIAGIPDPERRFSPGPGHWSIHENVVHVADTDLVAATRIRYVLAQPGSLLIGFDQERWAAVLDYRAQPIDEALDQFRAIRRTTTDFLRRAPAEAWEHTGVHTEQGLISLEWMVDHFADHVHYHLRTIAKRRGQYAEARAARA
jgi:DinB superfamily